MFHTLRSPLDRHSESGRLPLTAARHSAPAIAPKGLIAQSGVPLVRLDTESQGTPAPAPAPGVTPPSPPAPAAPAPAPAAPTPAAAGVLTPQDNFSGRSTTRFGVGEVIDLSVNFTPSNPLAWQIVSGGGTLVNGTNGAGTYTAPARASTVTLELVESAVSGAATVPRVLSTHTFKVVEPNDALMIQQPGTGIRHTNGFWDVGFLGEAFLRPRDVSFQFIQWREGSVAAVATGFLAGFNGLAHAVGSWMSVTGGSSATGSKVNMFDTIYSGQLSPPFGNGIFIWAIPWQFRVGSSAAKTFTTANHIALALDFPSVGIVGRASIQKKGAGPFVRDAADPTSSH